MEGKERFCVGCGISLGIIALPYFLDCDKCGTTNDSKNNKELE